PGTSDWSATAADDSKTSRSTAGGADRDAIQNHSTDAKNAGLEKVFHRNRRVPTPCSELQDRKTRTRQPREKQQSRRPDPEMVRVVVENPVAKTAVQKIGEARALDTYATHA
ncbi:hypothetical protein, partial [Accumulibacter sp.]|uniref:hypothetical protein n=1 Tax=Accumulibacter sp. TaxID=2053492 RepID=UPI0025BA806F